MLEINILLLFIIAAAIIAMEAKDLLSAVISIGAAGIGLSMAFLVLKAPDLAMMQLVVEILCLIILISATIKRDLPFSTSGRWLFNTLATLLFIVAFLSVAYTVLKMMPSFGQGALHVSAGYREQGLLDTGSHNLVAAITDNYRAFDTLAEALIVFTAVIGVLALARRNPKSKES